MGIVCVDAEVLERLVPMLVRCGIFAGVTHLNRPGSAQRIDIVAGLVMGLGLLGGMVELFGLLEERSVLATALNLSSRRQQLLRPHV